MRAWLTCIAKTILPAVKNVTSSQTIQLLLTTRVGLLKRHHTRFYASNKIATTRSFSISRETRPCTNNIVILVYNPTRSAL